MAGNGGDGSPPRGLDAGVAGSDANADTEDLLSEAGDHAALVDLADDDGEPAPAPVTKIIFCSRTHSQLAQFMRELRSR